jgi:hypothetical protein
MTYSNKTEQEMTVKTRHPASIRNEQEQREIRMYGCTEAQMREAVEESLTFRFSGPAMMAASLMSDCQEMLASDNAGQFDIMIAEDVRQALNRAKWILFTYVMTEKK